MNFCIFVNILKNELRYQTTKYKLGISFESRKYLSIRKNLTSNVLEKENLFSKIKENQIKSMNEEICILVNKNDKVVGKENKKECHLMKNIEKGLLHRAFSVIMFNSKNECLLTQRAHTKITFPNYFTNACCSHPLYNELEMEEINAIGVKRAAQRRLNIELGIKATDVPLNEFFYLTRILYKAPSDGNTWGEHEIDYILILKKDVQIKANKEEISFYKYLNKNDFRKEIDKAQKKNLVTPWFLKIHNQFLYHWWDNLDDLKKFKDHKNIHRLS